MKIKIQKINENDLNYIKNLPVEAIPITIYSTKRPDILYSKFEEIIYTLLEDVIESGKKIIIREQEVSNIDTLAIRLCKENPEVFILERYKIQWDIYNKSAGYVNLKFLLQGRDSELPSLLLLSFLDKWDKLSDKKMMDILIEDFNSSLTFLNYPTPYLFKNVYSYKS